MLLREFIAAESKGKEGKLGMRGDAGTPGIALVGCVGLVPESGDRIGVVAVVDLDILEPLLTDEMRAHPAWA